MDNYKGILVFAEQSEGNLHHVTYELLGKANSIGKSRNIPVYSLLMGDLKEDMNELVYRGSEKVFHIPGDLFSMPDEMVYVENMFKAIEEIKPETILIGATSFGRSIAPRLAAKLDTGLTADCTELQIDDDGRLVQIRPAFSDNILAHIKTDTLPQMATIRYKEFEEAVRNPELAGEIVALEPVEVMDKLVEILSKISSKEVDISEAEVVVAGGRGLKSPEDFNMLSELAAKLGGVVGASRTVVDEGFISKDHQVGYSGNRVKPKMYIACGISGAAQHLAGMTDSEVVIAINNDPSAPIFNYADIGIVGDLYEIIPQMISFLNAQGGRI